MRLDANNRILVAQGLARIRAGRAQPGIAALFAVAGRDPRRATRLRPGLRRRAAPQRRRPARRHDARHPVPARRHRRRRRCRSPPSSTASNRERRDVEADDAGRGAGRARRARRSTPTATRTRSACTTRTGTRAWSASSPRASRTASTGRRSSFARGSGGELKGSGRSIAGLHLRDALDSSAKRAPGLLARFGGHAYAAGLTLAEADLPRFAALFEAVAREQLSPARPRAHARDRRRARAGRARPRARRSAARARSGARAFPPRCSTTPSPCSTSASSAGSHSKLALARGGERFDAILFRHADPLPRRSARPTGPTSTSGTASVAAARHRALAAGLRLVDRRRRDPPTRDVIPLAGCDAL